MYWTNPRRRLAALLEEAAGRGQGLTIHDMEDGGVDSKTAKRALRAWLQMGAVERAQRPGPYPDEWRSTPRFREVTRWPG